MSLPIRCYLQSGRGKALPTETFQVEPAKSKDYSLRPEIEGGFLPSGVTLSKPLVCGYSTLRQSIDYQASDGPESQLPRLSITVSRRWLSADADLPEADRTMAITISRHNGDMAEPLDLVVSITGFSNGEHIYELRDADNNRITMAGALYMNAADNPFIWPTNQYQLTLLAGRQTETINSVAIPDRHFESGGYEGGRITVQAYYYSRACLW